jgi:hypothetical protein
VLSCGDIVLTHFGFVSALIVGFIYPCIGIMIGEICEVYNPYARPESYQHHGVPMTQEGLMLLVLEELGYVALALWFFSYCYHTIFK